MASLYFLAGLMIFWTVLLTLIFRYEKRMVWPYGELEARPALGDAIGYAGRTVQKAVEAGFTLHGWARDLKGKNYKVSYAMLSAPEGDVFAIVGTGSVMRIAVNSTWLFTRSSDGRCFYSADHQAAIQSDPSGHWKNQLVPAAPFDCLLQTHRAWIQTMGVMVLPFSQQNALQEFREVRSEHYHFMERAGLIEFTDASAQYFRFTLLGAFQTATRGYFLGMARKLSHGSFPRSA